MSEQFTPSDEVEQLRRIRELCIKALVRATGYSRDAIEDAPLTCAIKHADEVERLRSASSEKRCVPVALWDEIAEFIEGQVDVRDGDDGPRPNTAMHLSQQIKEAGL